MKKFLYPLLFMFSFLVSSCEKWLDVKPADQLADDEIFSSESTMKDLLTGVYTNMATRSLYGSNLTAGFLDVISRRYSNTYTNPYHVFYDAATHDYSATSVIDITDAVWKQMYFSIAQLNYLLNNIDEYRSVFSTEGEYIRVKAEALGLRAYIHFDILRLFAPSFVSNSGAAAIPYMTEYTVVPQQSLTVDAVTLKCLEDLRQAESLFGSISYQTADRYEFNIWAAKATMGRIYLYRSDNENALRSVVDILYEDSFSFVSSATVNSYMPDRIFPDECLFSLYSYDLPTVQELYFTPQADGATVPTNNYLLVSESEINTAYEYETAFMSSDTRYTTWWVAPENSTIRFMAKFLGYGNDNQKQYRMPLIRLSELYLIAAESAPSLTLAATYFNKFRVARILPEITFTSEEHRHEEIRKEYVKEYYGEGQLFYYYKRRGVDIPGATVYGNNLFVLPMPEEEVEFRF